MIGVVALAIACALAVYAILARDMLRAILAFAGSAAALSAAMFAAGASYAAVFQLLIYSGAVSVLFLAILHTGGGEEVEQ